MDTARRLALAVPIILNFAAAATAGPAQIAPRVSGPAETVFDWRTDRCAEWDIPDTPARAWRDAAGRARLIAGAEASRASLGRSLDRLARDCAVVFRGAHADDPAAYDDRAWIHAVFTADGLRVEALAHVEYHGQLRPERCAAAEYAACWRNAIVQVVSDDGGGGFRRDGDGAGLVAALPYRYAAGQRRRSGYFNPSNILRRGAHLYVFIFAEATGAQRRGACLLRRPLAGAAADWRAWDGADFTVRFADPYREDIADPAAHVCAPLRGVASTISGVVRHAPSGAYLALTAAARRGPDGKWRSGVWWMTSRDLIAWSAPRLLYAVPLLWRRDCARPAAYAYPAMLDDDSASRVFDTVDDDFWMYLVEMRVDGNCRIGPRRDLLRLPLSWPQR